MPVIALYVIICCNALTTHHKIHWNTTINTVTLSRDVYAAKATLHLTLFHWYSQPVTPQNNIRKQMYYYYHYYHHHCHYYSKTLLSRTRLSQISIKLDTFRESDKPRFIQTFIQLIRKVTNATQTRFHNKEDRASCLYVTTACLLIIVYPAIKKVGITMFPVSQWYFSLFIG